MNGNSVGSRVPFIDGLRAVAVLAVLAYHFELNQVSQGLLGVDIFFVISGYVVSRSLIGSVVDERFELTTYLENFYRRRFWRIVPALLAMISVTFLFVYFFVPPAYLSSQIYFTGIAAVGGVSNITLALGSRTNYFDQMMAYNPFLHTWSLGVEEQFYLLVPLLLWVLWKLFRQHAIGLGTLLALALLSFGLSVWWSVHNPTFAFYLLPTRFWELAAGCMVFMASIVFANRFHINALIASLSGWCGLVMVLIALVLPHDLASPFPAAVLPVLGTSVLLAFGSYGGTQRGSPYRWLSLPAATYIGRISYSLYLWHWPVVVLLRWTVGFEQTWQIGSAFLLTFMLAIASFHVIEQPFQNAFSKRKLHKFVFIPAFIVFIAYGGTVLIHGHNRNFTHTMPSRSVVASQFGWRPSELPDHGSQWVFDPKLSSRRPALFVVGDSHAGAISGAAAMAAKTAEVGLTLVTDGCSFNLMWPLARDGRCTLLLDSLEKAKAGDVVMFAALNLPRYVNQDGAALPQPDFSTQASIDASQAALVEFVDVVERLRERGVGVIVRGPEPLFRFIPFRCSDWYNRDGPMCSEPRKELLSTLLDRAKPALTNIAELKKQVPDVVVLDVLDVLCSDGECPIYDKEGHPLFSDQDHLSGWGADKLLPALEAALTEALATVSSRGN